MGGQLKGSKTTSILGFSEADEYKGASSLFETYADLREIKSLPFADCEFGNPYVLTSTNEVYYLDYTGGYVSSQKVADSFEEFISRIVVDDSED